MKKPLKIAIYSGEIPSTTFIERLIEGLAEDGFVIYLFGVKKQAPSYQGAVYNYGYVNTLVFKLFYLFKYWLLLTLFKIKEKKQLDTLLKSEGRWTAYTRVKTYPVLWHRPDIFHVQWAKGLDDWTWVQAFGMKLVLSLRGAHINYSPVADLELAARYRENFPKVDGFHAVSKAISLEAQKYGARPNKIRVLYSGVDLDLIAEPIKKPKELFKMVSVGRPHWKKGYHYALDCCRILKAQGLDFHYTIVGGAGTIELQYQLVDLKLEDCVTLEGNLPFAEVKEKMRSSHLFLLPSVEEGIANVVLEAMVLGTPVLTTNCGGMAEVVKDGVNGFVCPVRNPEAMAKKVIEINQIAQDTLETIVRNAEATIQNQHTIDGMVEGMGQLYLDVIKKS